MVNLKVVGLSGALRSFECRQVAKKYVRIRAMGLPLATMACAMYGLCVGRGDTKTPLVVTVLWTYIRLRKLIQRCSRCIRRDRAEECRVCMQSIDLRYS